MTPIALVGIDCRFPGARDTEAFWRLLMDGVVTDTEVPPQRWDINSFYHPDGIAGSMNTRHAHFLDDIDAFDNDFFSIAPVEAAALDPQQRLLLQSSWRAFEDAGIDPRSLSGTPTGVFVGIMSSEWSNAQILDFAGITPMRGTGSGYFMAANRISYHLNLTGPSMAIDSACSSSLMAVHQACVSLRSGETDTVIAAGVNLLLIPALSIFYTQAGLSAPDGRCKPFGLCADGIGRGEGVAAVVLRRLDDAVADRQPIYAVVNSSISNHDGRSNGITAPSRRSQVELMQRALSSAHVEADDINFVEAHGTGTALGDMIEANALGDVHRSHADRPCLLGSVKGNIGHTEGSAGIASFIKASLALHHRVLPPTVFGDSPNPALRLGEQGLLLADRAQPLSSDHALGAVSSFGLGGSNAHLILESAPNPIPSRRGSTGVLTISAPSGHALRRNAGALTTALETIEDDRLASWCRTTNVVKRSHRHRLVMKGDRGTLVTTLRKYLAGARPDLESSAPIRKVPARVGLLCSGQGSQYPRMTRALYEANPCYRRHLDTVAAALRPHLPSDVLAAMFGDGSALDRTDLAQPALFAVSYALGRTLLQTGVRPAFGIGHSVGEFAMASLAGVLSVGDAARLVARRAELMASLPNGGAMIAVDLDPDQAEALLLDEPASVVAAINGPRSLSISGPVDSIARIRTMVRANGGHAVPLTVSNAFHSPLMEPIVAEFRRELSGLKPSPADFPLYSTVLGREVAGDELDADYWSSQICAPVKFFEAVRTAVGTVGADYIAELGPQSTLLRLIRQAGLPVRTEPLVLCGGPDSDGSELLTVAATLLREGYSPELSPLYGDDAGTLQRIPQYVFDTSHRFWFDHQASVDASPIEPAVTSADAEPAHPVREPTDVDSAVLQVIAGVGGYPLGGLSWSSLLADDLGYDSLLQLRLFERLRAEYPELQDVSLAEVVPRVHTVGDLVDFVARRLDQPGVA